MTGIARVPDVPPEEVQDELRGMARKSLVHEMEHGGKIGVTIAPEGEGARDVFVDTFVNKPYHDPKAASDPHSVFSSL